MFHNSESVKHNVTGNFEIHFCLIISNLEVKCILEFCW